MDTQSSRPGACASSLIGWGAWGLLLIGLLTGRVSNAQELGAQPPKSVNAEADYARVYRSALEAQEKRRAVPVGPAERRAYVLESRKAMPESKAMPEGVRYLLAWNHVALDVTAMDHNSLSGTFGEQFGPTRTSRALAIVHLAMFEAVNTIKRTSPSYQQVQASIIAKLNLPADEITPDKASVDRAIIEAGYQTLRALYPQKADFLITFFIHDRTELGDGPGSRIPKMILGERIGLEAAKAVLSLRSHDRSEFRDSQSDIFNSPAPGIWQKDPISKAAPALGVNWRYVTPFLIESAEAYRPGNGKITKTFPAFTDPKFVEAFKEVKRLGGDPHAAISENRWPTLTERTGAETPSDPDPADNTNQTFVGIYWGYDGTALLCAPPRMYNMIATSVALNEQKLLTIEDFSQYLALINVAMADAGIAAWESKYYFMIARPVTYIRSAGVDDTPWGTRDPNWTPLGAPVTNGAEDNRNLTPPFPSYPSGHATFGAALFQSMIEYFKHKNGSFPDDGVPFYFVSDEYNGVNRGPGQQTPRTKIETHFDSFRHAERLNADSRIYLGIHWKFDADDGIAMGQAIGKDTFTKFVKP